MKLKDGDILICSGDRFIPNLIKKVTKSKYNHSALYMEVKGCPGVIEAQLDGINWKPFDVWLKKYKYTYIVYRKRNFSKVEVNFIARKAFRKAGHVGYDLVSFCLRQPFKLITGKWKYRGEKREVERMICSEYVSWVYDLPNWWKHTPDDQKKYLDKSKSYYLVKKR